MAYRNGVSWRENNQWLEEMAKSISEIMKTRIMKEIMAASK
jgi:truncated hemoglobin YjbI